MSTAPSDTSFEIAEIAEPFDMAVHRTAKQLRDVQLTFSDEIPNEAYIRREHVKFSDAAVRLNGQLVHYKQATFLGPWYVPAASLPGHRLLDPLYDPRPAAR